MSELINVICFDQLPDDAKRIRIDVFVDEQGFNEEFDTIDGYAYHFVAYDKAGAPVGTCRIFKEDENGTFFLGRMAVTKDARKLGVGRTVLSCAEVKAKELGAELLLLHSQCRAKEFYEKCGYTAFGEIELDEGCPHIWMKKDI